MPTADAQMVKLPRRLVARWDELRGDVDRPVFLEALLEAYDRQEIVAEKVDRGQKRVGKPPRQKRLVAAAQPGKVACPHPRHRRIGDGCADCGATGLK